MKEKKKQPPKTYCFIDSQNLHLGIKDQLWELDYQRFFVYLQEKYKVDKVLLYIGFIKENKKLYDFLSKCGYELVFKNTKQFGRSREHIKGNIDVDMTVDSIRRGKEYEKAIFVSADGDFVALYDYLTTELGKDITILVPNRYKYSSFLLKYKRNLRFMNDLKEKLKV